MFRFIRSFNCVAPSVRRFTSAATVSQSLLSVGKLNHVAIAVPKLSEAASLYRDVLGAKVSEPDPIPEHGVTVVFVELGETKIELITPLGEASPIANFLAKNPKGGIHHVCIETADVKKAITVLNEKGLQVLGKEPKIGAHGNPVIFIHPKEFNGVLVELEEVKP